VLALYFGLFGQLAFALIFRESLGMPARAADLLAASLNVSTGAVCFVTCVRAWIGRPVTCWVWGSLGMVVLTIVCVTAWRPFYYVVF
jgi:hypothetical protein